jgi:hypothetical protein
MHVKMLFRVMFDVLTPLGLTFAVLLRGAASMSLRALATLFHDPVNTGEQHLLNGHSLHRTQQQAGANKSLPKSCHHVQLLQPSNKLGGGRKLQEASAARNMQAHDVLLKQYEILDNGSIRPKRGHHKRGTINGCQDEVGIPPSRLAACPEKELGFV